MWYVMRSGWGYILEAQNHEEAVTLRDFLRRKITSEQDREALKQLLEQLDIAIEGIA